MSARPLPDMAGGTGFGRPINAIAIMLGLRPLARASEALSKVREGTAKRLDGTFPAEIEPLAHETNALIENRALESSGLGGMPDKAEGGP
jgi:hypothetical protein